MASAPFDSTKLSLLGLLEDAKRGSLQLPDFQRGWVWDDEHVRDLIASLSQAFPIGAIMLLEAGGEGFRFKMRPLEGAEGIQTSPEHLILDGQQRLTSLFQAIYSGKPVATTDSKKKKLQRWYYMDVRDALDPQVDRLDAIVGVPEDRKVWTDFGRTLERDLSSPDREYEEEMFPLAALPRYREWRRGFNRFWEHEAARTEFFDRFEEEVLESFSQYQIPVITLSKEVPKEAICLVFEKVNTGGVSLTVFELLTASFAAEGFELRPDWQKRKKRLVSRPVLSKVEATDFLQAVTLVSTFEARREAERDGDPNTPSVGCKRRDILRLTADQYKAWADEVEAGFRMAERFLHREFVFHARFLPYNTQLIPLAAFFTALGRQAEDQGVHGKLVRWFWCGVFGELYGSGTDTRFARDMVEVVQWIESGPEPRTIEEANFAPERLLSLRTRRSAAYRGLYVLLLREGARDFRTGEPSNLQSYFDEQIDIHHIFPRKWCRDEDIEDRLCNSIVNKTPLTRRTNRIVGGNAPSQYLSSLERNHGVAPEELDESLRSHLIEPDLFREDQFEPFFRSRSRRLLQEIADIMGKRLEHDPTEEWIGGEEDDIEPAFAMDPMDPMDAM